MTEIAKCWGLRVGGSQPYIAYVFQLRKQDVVLTETYHRAIEVAIVPLSEWKRLIKNNPNRRRLSSKVTRLERRRKRR